MSFVLAPIITGPQLPNGVVLAWLLMSLASSALAGESAAPNLTGGTDRPHVPSAPT